MKKWVFTSNLSLTSAKIDGTEGFKKYSDKMPEMPENSGKKCQKFQNIRWVIEFQLVGHNVTRGQWFAIPGLYK